MPSDPKFVDARSKNLCWKLGEDLPAGVPGESCHQDEACGGKLSAMVGRMVLPGVPAAHPSQEVENSGEECPNWRHCPCQICHEGASCQV